MTQTNSSKTLSPLSSPSRLSNLQEATTQSKKCNPTTYKAKRNCNSALSKSSSSRHLFSQRVKPAELFRTDFITAMKLPDTEILTDDNYFLITDQWKLDWEKGVQVPVKEDALNQPNSCINTDKSYYGNLNRNKYQIEFDLLVEQSQNPLNIPEKYLCPIDDKDFDPNEYQGYATHRIVNNTTLPPSLSICKYDYDKIDAIWLTKINYELLKLGQEAISRVRFEKLIENFETQSHENLKKYLDKFKNYNIEYDEGIVCEVCKAPDSEVSNEMVFCDGCNICVHQACYGIEKIPKGSWLCATCSYDGSSFRPECLLCPNSGGAMKATRNFRHWCHVSCVLWIPEAGFGNPNKMEPVININQIPASRWQLVCCLCKEKRGCCVQCSEKKCHASFHVTCAHKHNLVLETILSSGEDVVFKGYCLKHSKKYKYEFSKDFKQPQCDQDDEPTNNEKFNNKKINKNESSNDKKRFKSNQPKIQNEINSKDSNFSLTIQNSSLTNAKSKITDRDDEDKENESDDDDDDDDDEDDEEKIRKFLCTLQTMNENERKIATLNRLEKIYFKFYKGIDLNKTQAELEVDNKNHISFVFNYWKLKRRFNKPSNKALMFQRSENDLMNQSERSLILKMNMFTHLRHDLERLRNLCYLVIRREKQKLQYFELNRIYFEKQIEYLSKYKSNLAFQYQQGQSTSNNSIINKPLANTSSNDLYTSNQSRSCRIRDILQLKTEQCIYDYPEKWTTQSSNFLCDFNVEFMLNYNFKFMKFEPVH